MLAAGLLAAGLLASGPASSAADTADAARIEVRGSLLLVKRSGLERQMEAVLATAGFDQDLDFRPFSYRAYPSSATGDIGSFAVNVAVRVADRLAVHVGWDHEEFGRAHGHRAAENPSFLDTSRDYFVESVAEAKSLSLCAAWSAPPARFMLGPVLQQVEKRTLQRETVIQTELARRVGLALGVGASVPERTRIFLDLGLEYRWLGSVEWDPVVVPDPAGSGTTHVIPAHRMTLSHGTLSLGLGMRW